MRPGGSGTGAAGTRRQGTCTAARAPRRGRRGQGTAPYPITLARPTPAHLPHHLAPVPGVGIQFGALAPEGGRRVEAPLSESPAEAAGVLRGDRVLQVCCLSFCLPAVLQAAGRVPEARARDGAKPGRVAGQSAPAPQARVSRAAALRTPRRSAMRSSASTPAAHAPSLPPRLLGHLAVLAADRGHPRRPANAGRNHRAAARAGGQHRVAGGRAPRRRAGRAAADAVARAARAAAAAAAGAWPGRRVCGMVRVCACVC